VASWSPGPSTSAAKARSQQNPGLAQARPGIVLERRSRLAAERGCDLAELKLSELQQFSSLIEKDVFEALKLDGSLKSRSHLGGTAPVRVKAAIAKARKAL